MQLFTGTVVAFKPRKSRKPVLTRIMDKTAEPQGPNGCRVFTGSYKQSTGRPQISAVNPLTGKITMRDASKVVLEHDIGRALQPGEHSLHKVGCLHGCVTPGHCRVGDHPENMADKIADGTSSGRKLTPAKAKKMVEDAARWSKQKKAKSWIIAKLCMRHGISNHAVRNVLVGRAYAKHTGVVFIAGKPGRPRKAVEVKRAKNKPAATMEVHA